MVDSRPFALRMADLTTPVTRTKFCSNKFTFVEIAPYKLKQILREQFQAQSMWFSSAMRPF